MRFSACVEVIFPDRPLIDRLDAVCAAGLDAFEFWGWRDKDLAAIRRRKETLGLTVATFCIDTGQPLIVPPDTARIRPAVEESLVAAKQLDCRTLILTVASPGGQDATPDVPRVEQHRNIVAGLKLIAPLVEAAGITVVVEPLNVLVDHPGYYLTTSAEGFEILNEVGSPAVKLLFDVYHQQITEGNLLANIVPHIKQIGHFHVADVPGRHEPGTGEINYANLFCGIDTAGYEGFVGLEYWPKAPSADTLRTVKALAPD